MKKILSGLFGLTATLAVVTGVAFANWGQATVSGLTVTAPTWDIQISSNNQSYGADFIPASANINLANLTPEGTLITSFWLQNNHPSVTTLLAGQVTVDSGDLSLEPDVDVAFVWDGQNPTFWNWKSLSNWKSGTHQIEGNLQPSGKLLYHMYARINSSVTDPSSLAGKSITGLQFALQGVYDGSYSGQ